MCTATWGGKTKQPHRKLRNSETGGGKALRLDHTCHTRSQEPSSERGGIFENEGEDFVSKNGKSFGNCLNTKRQRMMEESENAVVEQIASDRTVAPFPQTFISTDDLLDCLVNPQVTEASGTTSDSRKKYEILIEMIF